MFYSYFASLGLAVTVEDATNLGRIDMTLQFNGQVYIFEFKVVELVPEEARPCNRSRTKGYADKYQDQGQPIYLIGVEFNRNSRNIVGFEVETVAV
ncbi:MAG: PD-(D/E)XK nuclease domain-containing protein [Thiolinea sp.]